MHVILDSNIYVSSYRMDTISFQNLFDYLNKTKSSLVLPRLVREEVVADYVKDLKKAAKVAKEAIHDCRRVQLKPPATFSMPTLSNEKREMRQHLMKPKPGVSLIYLAKADGVQIDNVFMRGIQRRRPSNDNGEELRDVILWFIALNYCKQADQDVAFITNDGGFWLGNELHPQIAADIKDFGVKLTVYRSLDEFIEKNSPKSKPINEEWVEKHFSVLSISDKILDAAKVAYKRRWAFAGNSTFDSALLTSTKLKDGKLFEIADNIQYAEVDFNVTCTLQTTNYVPVVNQDSPYQNNILFGNSPYHVAQTVGRLANTRYIVEPIMLNSPFDLGPQVVYQAAGETKAIVTGIASVSVRLVDEKVTETELRDFQAEKVGEA
jgi:hypothetical protein